MNRHLQIFWSFCYYTFRSLLRILAIICCVACLISTLAGAKTKNEHSLFNNFTMHSEGDVSINQRTKMLSTNQPCQIGTGKFSLNAHNLALWYQSLNQLDLDHINRIEAKTNLVFTIKNSLHSVITADRYVYTLNSKAHVLLSNQNPIKYQDSTKTLIAHDRVEYFAKKHIAIVRGHPKVIGSKPCFTLKANRFNIQLTEQNKLDFAEAVGAVCFAQNGTTVTSKYAIFYNKTHKIEFYDHVTFSSKSVLLKGCAAIYDLKTGKGRLIPCGSRGDIEGQYHQ